MTDTTFRSKVYSDDYRAYRGLRDEYVHEFVRHSEEYVRGSVHTNGIENFWSLLKRCVKGTYVSVEPFHMSRYLDEQMFRFNQREHTDLGRFLKTMKGIVGRRLTFAELTGKTGQPEPAQP